MTHGIRRRLMSSVVERIQRDDGRVINEPGDDSGKPFKGKYLQNTDKNIRSMLINMFPCFMEGGSLPRSTDKRDSTDQLRD